MNLDAPLSCEAATLVSVFVLEEKEVELSRFCFWFRIPLYVALNSSCVAKLSFFNLLAVRPKDFASRGNCRWISEVVAETSSGCCGSYQMCIGGRWSLRTFPSLQLSPETQLLFRSIWDYESRIQNCLIFSIFGEWKHKSELDEELPALFDWKRGFEDLAKTTCATCVVSGGFGREYQLQRFVRNFADWGWLSAGGGETSFTLNSPSIEYWGAAAIEYWTVELAMEKNIEPMVIFCIEL